MKLNSIAFVACNKNPCYYWQDPSFIYRCENVGLALQALGCQVKYLHYTELKSSDSSDVIVFHRPQHRLFFSHKLKSLAKSGSLLVADVDDLIFHPDWAEFSPGVRNQLVPLRLTQSLFKKNLKALQQFHCISVSTNQLQQRLNEVLPAANSFVLHNSVHLSWYSSDLQPAKEIEKPTLISYWPGTRSHDRDFELITAPLEQIFSEQPHLKLMITGPLQTRLKIAEHQLVHAEKVPFANYIQVVKQAHINLLPLEQTLFNQHKSALKVIEASFFGIPTLASPLPDLVHLPAQSYSLMQKDTDWYHRLHALCSQSLNSGNYRHKPEPPDVIRYAQQWLNWLKTALVNRYA